MDLSIVIPVWNEQTKIRNDILNLDRYCSNSSRNVELIIVDDGSTDGTVGEIRRTIHAITLRTHLISNDHRGKGHAVRSGILAANGEIILFMDCGANVPLHYIDKGIELLEKKQSAMVLGTRYRSESIITLPMTPFRRFTSALFRKITKILLELPTDISDSQCGFKIFRNNAARDIFGRIKADGFLFDLEVILIARQMGYSYSEIALQWRCDRDSRLSVTKSLFPVIKELSRIKKL